MMLCIHIFLLLFDRLRPDFLYPLAVAAGHFISSIYCGQTFLTAIHDLSWPDILHLPPFAAEYFKLNAFRGRTFNVKHLSESKILYPEPFKSRAYAPRPLCIFVGVLWNTVMGKVDVVSLQWPRKRWGGVGLHWLCASVYKPYCIQPSGGWNHRVHKVATAAFLRTLSHEGKISPGWWGWGVHAHPVSLHLPSPVKLQCTLQLSGQTLTLFHLKENMYSVDETG